MSHALTRSVDDLLLIISKYNSFIKLPYAWFEHLVLNKAKGHARSHKHIFNN